MKKLFMTAVAAIAVVASASANAQRGMEESDTPAEKTFAYECVVDRVTPADHDKDPGYKVNIETDMHQFLRVWHTLKSGKIADRTGQYEPKYNGTKRENADWSTSPLVWYGPSKANPKLSMYGIIGTQNADGTGKLLYVEELFRGNEKKPVMTINTTCHQVNA
jgi:hypothetical protein